MIKFLVIAVCFVMPLFAVADNKITTVDVFVAQPLIVPAIPYTRITVFDLSRVESIRATAPRFPAEIETAKVMAKTWLDSAEGKNYISQLKAAYSGRTKMIEYGVLKLPAVVFDAGKYVVYGTTDIQQAVKDYDEYMRINQGAHHDE